MKILSLHILFILITTGSLFSQDFWELVTLPDSIEPHTVFLTAEDDFLLGTFEHGIYKTDDDGMSWQHMGISYGIYNIVQMSNGDLYAGANSGLLKSVNGGLSWYHVASTEFAIISMYCSSDDDLFIGTWGGIHKSVDSGYTWTQVLQSNSVHVFNDFAEKEGSLYSSSVHFLGNNDGIYGSEDGGDTWSLWSMAGIGVTPLTIDINEYMLAGVATHYPAGLFRITDDGQSWEQLFGGADVVSILPDESNGIYIGLESDVGSEWGVRHSPDNGNSWEDISSGMEYITRVTDLGFNSNDYLFAVASSPRSLYRSVNPIVGIQEPNENCGDIKVFPNPFGSVITVEIPNSGHESYSVDIYNGSGILAWQVTTTDESQQITMDDQPPGVYLVRVYSKSQEVSRKIVKVR